MAELCREHQLTSQMIGIWKPQFLAAAPQAFESEVTNPVEQARIKIHVREKYPQRLKPTRRSRLPLSTSVQ